MEGSESKLVFEIVGSPFCVASGDGKKVYNHLYTALEHKQPVSLSFHNVSALTSAFLSVAIGQLYVRFSEEEIRRLLKVTDIKPEDFELLQRVVESTKRYLKDPTKYKQAIREELGN